MTTIYPQPIPHTNILFPSRVFDAKPAQRLMSSLAFKPLPEILHIQTVFPFDLFRDSLLVDANTVTIIHRGVPPIEHVETIPIETLTDVSVHRGFLLSTLVLVAANIRNPITLAISKLRPDEAQCAHRIIECLMAIKRGKNDDQNPISGNTHSKTDFVN